MIDGKRGLTMGMRWRAFIRMFVFVALAGGFCVLSPAVFAAEPVAGCNRQVLNAQQATAQARVARSKAIDDEIITQPDSALALSCFNQSAAVSGQQAGATFSGDFRPQLASVVDDAMVAMGSNFKKFTFGGKKKKVDYASDEANRINQSTAAPVDYNCDQISKLWKAVGGAGVDSAISYVKQSQLFDPDQPHAGGEMFQTALRNGNSRAIRTSARDHLDAMPNPGATPTPSCRGVGFNTACQVMVCKGTLPAGSCP